MDAVVGENRMALIGRRRDEMAEEVGGNLRGCFLIQLDEGEFRRVVDGDEEMELALFCPYFSDVDMEKADRIGLELLLRGLIAFDIGQSADAMTLQAAA